jgi:hypothetical protein
MTSRSGLVEESRSERGRKKTDADPGWLDALDRLIEPETRGGPASPLWCTWFFASATPEAASSPKSGPAGTFSRVANGINGGTTASQQKEAIPLARHDFDATEYDYNRETTREVTGEKV